MIFNFPVLLIAVALLWMPRQWLRLGSVLKRKRSKTTSRAPREAWTEHEVGDPKVYIISEFSKFRNFVDLLRAGFGSMAFAGFSSLGLPGCIALPVEPSRPAFYTALGIRAGVLLIGLLVQTVRLENGKFTFYPAIFYIGGLTLGLIAPLPALLAFAMVWALSALFPGPQTFLTAYAFIVVAFGHLHGQTSDLLVGYAGLLCFLPVMICLLTNRPLILLNRRGSRHSS